jgi:prolyl-tRNA synthetase
MRQSQLFTKSLYQDPKDAQTISHKYLVRAGYINQLTAGVWSLLPLGWRVYKKIENIIREELNKIGGQEVFLPVLQPREIWQRTNRWETMDPPLFKLKDRHEKWLCLGPTHEEVITDLASLYINSYRDLPVALYQIQTKFRNELRPTGGLLRTREFVMKDLYSFHRTEEDLDKYYNKVLSAYDKIFRRCGLETIAVSASSGSIGGSVSHEFMVIAEVGEDKILVCKKRDWGINLELGKDKKQCPLCKGELEQKNAIEVGHTFKLGTLYSEKMKAYFRDKDGKEKPIVMGCYGIGLQRLMATIVEIHHDEFGIIWPESVAPFNFHLLVFDFKNKKIKKFADQVYEKIKKSGFEILYDDREESPGVKLKDADLLGIPNRLIISQKTKEKIEYKKRREKKVELLSLKEILKIKP